MNSFKLATLLLAAVVSTSAAKVFAEAAHFQGFFSQGIIYSPDNPFFDDDTGTNFNYRELGLNVSWQANERLRLAGQALSRKAGLLENGDPRIDFLLLDYNFYVSESLSAGVRLGRTKNHYGLYNTSRDIPHGRPGVFVPQSIYFESMRTALLSSDGGNFYISHSSDFADIALDVYGGKAHFETESIEYALFQMDMPGEFDDVDGTGLKFLIEPKAIPGLTAVYTYLAFDSEYQDAPNYENLAYLDWLNIMGKIQSNPATLPEYLTSLAIDAKVDMYSLQYAIDTWVLTAEYMSMDFSFEDTELLNQAFELPRTSIDVLGYYFQAEWLPSPSYSIYARYEELYYDEDDKEGKDYAALGGNPITQYNKTYTLGARWYFSADFSATVEYSTNEGAAFLNGQTDVDQSELKKDWDLLIVQFSYHF